MNISKLARNWKSFFLKTAFEKSLFKSIEDDPNSIPKEKHLGKIINTLNDNDEHMSIEKGCEIMMKKIKGLTSSILVLKFLLILHCILPKISSTARKNFKKLKINFLELPPTKQEDKSNIIYLIKLLPLQESFVQNKMALTYQSYIDDYIDQISLLSKFIRKGVTYKQDNIIPVLEEVVSFLNNLLEISAPLEITLLHYPSPLISVITKQLMEDIRIYFSKLSTLVSEILNEYLSYPQNFLLPFSKTYSSTILISKKLIEFSKFQNLISNPGPPLPFFPFNEELNKCFEIHILNLKKPKIKKFSTDVSGLHTKSNSVSLCTSGSLIINDEKKFTLSWVKHPLGFLQFENSIEKKEKNEKNEGFLLVEKSENNQIFDYNNNNADNNNYNNNLN